MKTIETYGTFDEAIKGYDPQVQVIAQRLREIVIDIYPEVIEVPWPHQKTIGYGVGPKKMSEHFCYLAPQRARVNLGFFHGVELPDPGRLLEGTGKKLRHVKVESVELAESPAVVLLLRASLEERIAALKLLD